MSAQYRLVICDLDRTLLPSRELPLDDKVLQLVTDLDKAGVKFAVASGRQFLNLYRLFYPVKDSVVFLSENGSWISYRESALYESAIKRELALAVIDDILGDSEKEVLVSGKYTYYINPRSEIFLDRMFREIRATVTKVNDFSEITEPIIKISAYDDRGIEEHGAARLIGKWSGSLNAVVSGGVWVDISAGNKGTAARHIMEHFGILPDETVVFGDDNNDVPMFGVTKNSWCMSQSADNIKAKATHTTEDAADEIRKLILEQ